jgi:hypothetical protein
LGVLFNIKFSRLHVRWKRDEPASAIRFDPPPL